MRIAKPILLVSTPVGVIWGVTVAWQIHPWLAILMMVLVGIISLFIGYTVYVIRREQRAQTSSDPQKTAPMSNKIT